MSASEVIAIFAALVGRLTSAAWLRAFLPLLVWAALVWTIGGLDSVPGAMDVPTNLDKVAHLLMYGALGLLCGRAWRSSGGGVAVAVVLVVLALALGAADEWRQLGVVGRTASVADWVADAAGVLGGFFLAASYARQRQRT